MYHVIRVACTFTFADSYHCSIADTLFCTQSIWVEHLAGLVVLALVLAATLVSCNTLGTTEEEATVADAPLLALSFTDSGRGLTQAGGTTTVIANRIMAVRRALDIYKQRC